MPGSEEGCHMTDQTTIQINVETFGYGNGYFVRAEIDAHSVDVQRPFSRPSESAEIQGRSTGGSPTIA
jgi:hypothetical protein